MTNKLERLFKKRTGIDPNFFEPRPTVCIIQNWLRDPKAAGELITTKYKYSIVESGVFTMKGGKKELYTIFKRTPKGAKNDDNSFMTIKYELQLPTNFDPDILTLIGERITPDEWEPFDPNDFSRTTIE